MTEEIEKAGGRIPAQSNNLKADRTPFVNVMLAGKKMFYYPDSDSFVSADSANFPGVCLSYETEEQAREVLSIVAEDGEDVSDGLPDFEDLSDTFNEKIEEPKPILKDLVRVGQVFMLSGGSKTFKTMTIAELALAVSQGSKFLAWEAIANKVLIVDTELEKFDFRKRLKNIAGQKGIEIDRDEIKHLRLRGKVPTIDELVQRLISRVKGENFGFIIIDSLYSLLGDRDENSNGEMKDVGNLLHRLALETGCAVLVTMHHGKGDQSNRRALDRIVGGGALGRICDGALDIIAHGTKGHYNFETTLRTFADPVPFVARRNGTIWELTNEKPDNGKGKIDAELQTMLEYLAVNLGGDALSSEWQKLCCSADALNISKKQFLDRSKKAERMGLIKFDGKTKILRAKLTAQKDPITKLYKPIVTKATFSEGTIKVTIEPE
jgi:AAA domain